MVKKSVLVGLLIIGILSAIGGHGTIADFLDTEVSTGNAFETGIWRDGTIKVDIEPGSCPNPINVTSEGVLPVAILGTTDFFVDDLNPTSVRIWRNDNGEYIGGTVEPLPTSFVYEDTATPFYPTAGGDCCHDLTGDGIVDLNVEYDEQALVDDLELDEIPHGTIIYLRVTVLTDEVDQLEGQDCVIILNNEP